MQWLANHGDILDVPAEVLICSANVYLTLSGGVGGEFLLRYGSAMQDALLKHLAEQKLRHLESGAVVVMPPCNSPYRAVLHAVAIDGLYTTNIQLIADTITKSLRIAETLSAKTVALTALATGYGRQSITTFGKALTQAASESFQIERAIIGLRKLEDIEQLRHAFPRLGLGSRPHTGNAKRKPALAHASG
jgi:O-acetyl-ADP-ribose deacetylase (regulator of RNase III)